MASGSHRYRATPATGGCDSDSEDSSWFDQVMGARALISNAGGTGIYDRLSTDWDVSVVPDNERLRAISAIYSAAAYEHFGSFFCEMTFDGGPLQTPAQILAQAETWIGTAQGHIASAGGDFAMPYGIASSATDLANGLLARIRWANGDLAGAATAAALVPDGFDAWITRETGPIRRNKIYDAGTAVGYSGMLGQIDWWNGATTNPHTGAAWPNPIPFTGYIDLGIGPDGRAIDANGNPVLETDAGAVDDSRVAHFIKSIQGPVPRDVPDKYQSETDDIPFVTWREMRLIEAEAAGGQTAIDIVNDLRNAAGLPAAAQIGGLYQAELLADDEQLRYMILEERRREFFVEGGRYLATKILNTDVLWFPRGDGSSPEQGYTLQGGVRHFMPGDEYFLNDNISLADRGSGCANLTGQQPTLRDF